MRRFRNLPPGPVSKSTAGVPAWPPKYRRRPRRPPKYRRRPRRPPKYRRRPRLAPSRKVPPASPPASFARSGFDSYSILCYIFEDSRSRMMFRSLRARRCGRIRSLFPLKSLGRASGPASRKNGTEPKPPLPYIPSPIAERLGRGLNLRGPVRFPLARLGRGTKTNSQTPQTAFTGRPKTNPSPNPRPSPSQPKPATETQSEPDETERPAKSAYEILAEVLDVDPATGQQRPKKRAKTAKTPTAQNPEPIPPDPNRPPPQPTPIGGWYPVKVVYDPKTGEPIGKIVDKSKPRVLNAAQETYPAADDPEWGQVPPDEVWTLIPQHEGS